jgi:type I restriction enzyme M protein
MRKSLGDKRREIPPEKAIEILGLMKAWEEGENCKIFPTTHFGYRKITVERPLRLNFQATPGRIARIEGESGFRNLAVSRKKAGKEKAREEAEGRSVQEQVRKLLTKLPTTLYKDRTEFVELLLSAAKKADLKLPGWRGRQGRLRDQLQPVFLQVHSSPAARGHRGGYPKD